MGFQVAFESENVFAQSNVSRQRVSGGWSSNGKARRASSVCMRGTTSIGASEERRARGGARVCTSSLRYIGVAVVTYVGKPSAIGPPIRPTQPFILSG